MAYLFFLLFKKERKKSDEKLKWKTGMTFYCHLALSD